jgi:hypothetical protein
MLPGEQQQHQVHQQQQMADGGNNNNNLNNNNKNVDPKYQTLPYNTKFSNSNNSSNSSNNNASVVARKIEQLKQEKENNNVAFADALPRPPPPLVYGIGVVAPLPAAAVSHNAEITAASSSSKPVSSVAPVFAAPASSVSNNAGRYGTPGSGNLSVLTPPRLASTPLSAEQQPRVGGQQAPSPTKLRPALPPKPVMAAQPPVHGDEGTSVDDIEDLPPPPPTTEPPADSPIPEVDYINGNAGGGSKDMSVSVSAASVESSNGSGLMVAATGGEGGVHVSINR